MTRLTRDETMSIILIFRDLGYSVTPRDFSTTTEAAVYLIRLTGCDVMTAAKQFAVWPVQRIYSSKMYKLWRSGKLPKLRR